jgi:hypothetical protein
MGKTAKLYLDVSVIFSPGGLARIGARLADTA